MADSRKESVEPLLVEKELEQDEDTVGFSSCGGLGCSWCSLCLAIGEAAVSSSVIGQKEERFASPAHRNSASCSSDSYKVTKLPEFDLQKLEELFSMFWSVNLSSAVCENIIEDKDGESGLEIILTKKQSADNYANFGEYSHVNDYYRKLSNPEEPTDPVPWTQVETVFLYSISSAMDYCGGSEIHVNLIDDFQRYLVIKDCWERIKSAFDCAIKKYLVFSGKKESEAFIDRSWKELAEHRRVLENVKWCQENRFLFHDINELWFNKYNKGFLLFDPTKFTNQFRKNYVTLEQDAYVGVGKIYHLYEDVIKNAKMLCRNEKLVLVGAVFDRLWSYENRGGSALTPCEKSNLRSRTWLSIKKQYDLAMENALKKIPTHFNTSDFVDRSADELRIHYKLLFISSFCKFSDKKDSIDILLSEWCCRFNKDGALISRTAESLASKTDDRYEESLAEIDSMLKAVRLGTTAVLKEKKHELGLCAPHKPKEVAKSSSKHLLDELRTDDINHYLQKYPPSSLVYYQTNDYYNQISKMAGSFGFFNPWTKIEEIFLREISDAVYSIGGTKIVVPREFKVSPASSYSVFENIWKKIKVSLDRALKKHVEQVSTYKEAHYHHRSWEQLALHFRVILNIAWCPENRFFYRDMTAQWETKYNRGYVLFNPHDFRKQFEENNIMLLDQNSEHSTNKLAQLYSHIAKDMPPLSSIEETILYGAVRDRGLAYTNRGGSAITSHPNTELSRCTWEGIKKQYDLALKKALVKYPTRFGFPKYVNRTAEELRVQYKLMMMRPFCQIDGVRKRYIFEMLTEWCCELNKNGELISKAESLASQPDVRFYNYDVPYPEEVDRSTEEPHSFFESFVSGSYNYVAKKVTDDSSTLTRVSAFSPMNIEENKRTGVSIKDDQASGYVPSKKNKISASESPSSQKRLRIGNWTKDEEIILYGVTLLGSKYTKPTNSKSDGHFSCKAFKAAFDLARARHYKRLNPFPFNSCTDRSIETLVRRLEKLEEQAPINSFYENYLRHMWINKYNKNSMLLEEDYFVRTSFNNQSKKHDIGDILLFGVLIELIMATGVMYQYTNNKWSDAHDRCWKWVKCVFDRVWLKFYGPEKCREINSQHSINRKGKHQKLINELSWQGLFDYYSNHMLDVDLKNDPFFLFQLHEEWTNIYNKDHRLLHPDDFDRYSVLEKVPNRIPKLATTFQRAQKNIAKASNPNPWIIEEEAILVGVVIDRFLSCGLLSSAPKIGNGGKDCWDKIKFQFDLVCSNAITKTKVKIPSYKTRKASSLFARYRHIRGANSDTQYSPKARSQKLGHLYDRWQTVLNKDGAILSRSESLCNRYLE